jgi:hypothetical protein
MKNAIFAAAPDYVWEHIRGLEELLDYTRDMARSIDPSILYGLTSRLEALRDDLADELPPDPRALSPGRQIIRFPRRSRRGNKR